MEDTKLEKWDMLTPDTARVVAKLVTERRDRKVVIVYDRDVNFDKEARYFASILRKQFGLAEGMYRRITKKRFHSFKFRNGNRVVLTGKKTMAAGQFKTFMRYNVDGTH